ncbi:YraN family protein [Leptospira kobayashii]|uniref:YraN family protein n=1 Tax=Leptospira kobayashii TaxID=1917830 RepID=UPI000D599701|nr:YraN family protein [Leptospira kobayashii]
MKKTELGKWGEDFGADYLDSLGHSILISNFRNRFGELDIISFSGEVLYCTEVKTWNQTRHFHPLQVFNETKKNRMRKVYYYLTKTYPALSHLTVSFCLLHINEKREVSFYSHLF